MAISHLSYRMKFDLQRSDSTAIGCSDVGRIRSPNSVVEFDRTEALWVTDCEHKRSVTGQNLLQYLVFCLLLLKDFLEKSGGFCNPELVLYSGAGNSEIWMCWTPSVRRVFSDCFPFDRSYSIVFYSIVPIRSFLFDRSYLVVPTCCYGTRKLRPCRPGRAMSCVAFSVCLRGKMNKL